VSRQENSFFTYSIACEVPQQLFRYVTKRDITRNKAHNQPELFLTLPKREEIIKAQK
jgi:hypothetical protein